MRLKAHQSIDSLSPRATGLLGLHGPVAGQTAAEHHPPAAVTSPAWLAATAAGPATAGVLSPDLHALLAPASHQVAHGFGTQGDGMVLASPTARLPTDFGGLLASPDFACTFAPVPTSARPAGPHGQAPATAARPTGLAGLGSPISGLPLSSTALRGFPPLSTAFPALQTSVPPVPGGSNSGGSEAQGSAALPAFQLPVDWVMVPPTGPPAAPGSEAEPCNDREPTPTKSAASKGGRKKAARTGRSRRGSVRKGAKTGSADDAAAKSAQHSRNGVDAEASEMHDAVLAPLPADAAEQLPGLERMHSLGSGFDLMAQQAALLAPLLAISPRHPSGVLLWPQAPQHTQQAQQVQPEQQMQSTPPMAAVAATPAAAGAGPAGFATITPAARGAGLGAAQQSAAVQHAPSPVTERAAAPTIGKWTAPEGETAAGVAAATTGSKRSMAVNGATSSAPAGTVTAAQATPQPARVAANGRGGAKRSTPARSSGATSSEEGQRRRQRKTAQPRRSSLDGHVAPPKLEAAEDAAPPARSHRTPAVMPATAARTPAAKPPPAPRKPPAGQGKGKAPKVEAARSALSKRPAETAAEAPPAAKKQKQVAASKPRPQAQAQQQAQQAQQHAAGGKQEQGLKAHGGSAPKAPTAPKKRQQQPAATAGSRPKPKPKPKPAALEIRPAAAAPAAAAEAEQVAAAPPGAAAAMGRQRAAAARASLGIKACAAAEGSSSPRATQLPPSSSSTPAALEADGSDLDGEETTVDADGSAAAADAAAGAQRKRDRRGRSRAGKDPKKVAAALKMRQRLPGQLTRVQRFAFQILVHVDDSEGKSVLEGEVRRTFGNNPDVSKALRVLTEQGKLVRSGEGGRGTPFAYTATAKGQGAVAEARQKLQADADLLRSVTAAAGSGAAGHSAAAEAAAADEAAADEAPGGEAA